MYYVQVQNLNYMKYIHVNQNNIYFDESIHIVYKDILENTGEFDFDKKLQI